MADVTDLALGTAAEHLVCADLLMSGYNAFLADQNCAYDIAVDIGGRLVRIQVKATRCVRRVPQIRFQRSSYMFFVRRTGKGNRRVYGENDFDLLALVAMDTKQIGYVKPSQRRMTIHIRTGLPGEVSKYAGKRMGKTFADYQLADALKEISVTEQIQVDLCGCAGSLKNSGGQ